jgi:hypothetical protein
LTELAIDYITRQVPADRANRSVLRERAGTETIPVLVAAGEPFVGEDAILAYLAGHESVPAEARAHRLRAEKVRRRHLEEECECPRPPAIRSPNRRLSRSPTPLRASAPS